MEEEKTNTVILRKNKRLKCAFKTLLKAASFGAVQSATLLEFPQKRRKEPSCTARTPQEELETSNEIIKPQDAWEKAWSKDIELHNSVNREDPQAASPSQTQQACCTSAAWHVCHLWAGRTAVLWLPTCTHPTDLLAAAPLLVLSDAFCTWLINREGLE